jgi:hypothetical protein
MRKLISVCLLMLCLCFPVFGGHTMPGGWCECGSFAACICDPDELPGGNRAVQDESSQDKPSDLGSETLLVLALLLLMLRYKA